MEKTILRNKLFNKYFEIEEGMLSKDLVDKLSFIPETYKQLKEKCINNIKLFDSYSSIEKIKLVNRNQKQYLILKIRMWRYVIIDIDKMDNINKEQFKKEFNEMFFVNNFDEEKESDESLFEKVYHTANYNGDIKELLDFYLENQRIFNLTPFISYRFNLDNAWTFLNINLVNGNAQLGFRTKDQFLYESLFLNSDLTPSIMQDAQDKIGIERMQEMFDKITQIHIPKELIPADLYQEYIYQCKKEKNKLSKTLKK